MRGNKFKILRVIVPALAALLTWMCTPDGDFVIDGGGRSVPGGETKVSGRVSPVADRNVTIMVAGGRNSLAGYITEDMGALAEHALDFLSVGNYATDNILVVLSRIGSSYSRACPAVLYRLCKDRNGNVQRDTIKVWGDFTPLFGETTLKDALETVWNEFPATGYGMVLSSHASGYLPDGYYDDPNAWEAAHGGDDPGNDIWSTMSRRAVREEFPPIPEYPAVKSVGQDIDGKAAVEMDLTVFEESIPFKMDYILFDCCLMAGVEVAWQLKDKADIIGFSPTEIMADGFDYDRLPSRLISYNPDPVQVCRDYMAQYKGVERSDPYATISVVNTARLDNLAKVCKTLFEKYRAQMNAVNPDKIQRYWRANRHFFYDLRDIMAKSGASADDLAALDAALDQAILYKDHTDKFMTIPITDYSGLSMYLPSYGGKALSVWYKENIAWNKATELIK